jgi:general secretion pathway protein D
MKTTTLVLILLVTGLGLRAQTARPVPGPAVPAMPPAAAPPEEMIAPGTIDFQGVDVSQVLEVYAKLVGRTLLHAGLPNAQIVLETKTPLTRTEAIEALQEVLKLNGISVINVGDKFVKVVPSTDANGEGAPFNNEAATNLPDMGSYVTHIVQLKYIKPSEIMPALTPFEKLPNSVVPLDSNGILIIRDYAENVKRMLEMIEQVDVNVPEEYISEVIPILYAQADDIASALNSLGGSGTATVSFGASTATPTVSGFGGRNGTMGGSSFGNGGVQPTTPGTAGALGTTPNGTPSGATPFQKRLQAIINKASEPAGGTAGGQEPIQVFGQAKIIADERSNSLLVFATREDMERIKTVVAKLDVLLSQVLIEAVIIDYQLGPNTLQFGVSAAQNPQTYSPSIPVVGGGGFNNGPSLINKLNSLSPTSTNGASNFASSLGGGLSYFGNIGPNWDVALQAAATDSHASIIQRPRIQTSQAKPATFFVGETVPYVTGTSYGGAYGNQNNYSQLSVGVELDVTPFINPDGLVVMDIQQEIDDINGFTAISGVGNIPNTDKRTLSSEIAVRNGDTVMLGGFIKNQKSTSKSGVPFLQDIPLIGNLFSSRSDSKQREELIVMMRPTVLKTPQIAAENTIREEQRLPGVSAAAAEESADEHKIIAAERKKELKNPKAGGFYNAPMPTNAPMIPADINTTTPSDQTIKTNSIPVNMNAVPIHMNGGAETNAPNFLN